MITLKEIGKVAGKFREKADPFVMRKEESKIILEKAYEEGLYRLAESKFIQVIFGFHLSDSYALKGPVYTGETKGVFASRSPNRPSPLGVTTVKLLGIDKNILTVTGLDAVDGSPVYDIKPHASLFDETGPDSGFESFEKEWAYTDPRIPMIRLVRADDLPACLLKAGALHGHFCPGLASGVYAAVTGLKKIFALPSDGMENLLAVTETNNCFADGIQAVTGCTFGNNALIYHDVGKTAVTFAVRGKEKGIRIRMKPAFHAVLAEKYPRFPELFDLVVKQRKGTGEDMAAFKTTSREASFGLLSLPFESLFESSEVTVKVPAYAPLFDSLVCAGCGEQFMASRAVKKGTDVLCRHCGESRYPCLTGAGIINS